MLNDELESLEKCSQKLDYIFNEDYVEYLSKADAELKSFRDRSDTITVMEANKIVELQSLKVNFENFQKSQELIKNQISTATQNIENLRADIENEVGKRKDYQKNIHAESIQVEELSLLLDEMIVVKDSCIQNVKND